MNALVTLLLAATLASGLNTHPRRPARPPPPPIVVRITRPSHTWRDIGTGVAGGAGLVLLLLGTSRLTRQRHTALTAFQPTERKRR